MFIDVYIVVNSILEDLYCTFVIKLLGITAMEVQSACHPTNRCLSQNMRDI